MRVTLALVTTLALTLGACGGGGSHRGFVDEASDICRQANTRFASIEIVRPTAAPADAALGDIIEIGALALQDLRRVKPPKGDQAEVNSWLGALEQALDEVAYARTLLRDEKILLAVGAIERADVLTRRARVLARTLGLARVCAVPELLPDE
jgi:hypothetical protein